MTLSATLPLPRVGVSNRPRRILRTVTASTTRMQSDRSDQEQLLAPLAKGEPGAAKRVLERYGGLVWSLARKLCESDADAEDAVQDIFLDLWKSAERYDATIASETTFVALIARRRLIDRRRRISRQPRSSTIEYGVEDGGADAPEMSPATTDEARFVQEAMEELSPEQRRVIRLSVVHGLSHQSISEATGLPLGTVKTPARRGLIRARKIIAERHATRQGTDESHPGGGTDKPGGEERS